MRFDWYTKAVLTVIALCLVWMSVGGPSLLVPLSAQQVRTPGEDRIAGYNRVVIAGWEDYSGKLRPLGMGTIFPGTGIPVAPNQGQ